MNIIKFLKKLFEPNECYCQCHFGGHKNSYTPKGGVRQVSCEHCTTAEPVKSLGKWGTAVPV